VAEPLPHPDRVRVLLTDKRIPTSELAKTGERYFEAGFPNIAAMFFERAQSKDGLARLKRLALDDGDEFILTAVARADASMVQEADWRTCAAAALARGRLAFARDAFRKAGDEERAAEAQNRLNQELAAASPTSHVPRPKSEPSSPADHPADKT
jgi:hypothetical protein